MTFEEIKNRLQKLDTACLSDTNKEIRVLDPAIRPHRTDLKLIGRAHTVKCSNDFLTVFKALKEAQSGEVLMVDGQAGQRAVVGELFATEALRRGLAGIVVDGAVRDIQTIRKLDIPVYSRSVFPVSGTTSNLYETQVPISCAGVTVDPGDVIFGDQDGIVVASESELVELIPLAEEIQEKEEIVLARMAKGEGLAAMLNLDEVLEDVKAGRAGKLKFNL